MYQIDLWRCSKCSRILGRDICVGDGSELRVVCWGAGCGEVAVVRVAPAESPKAGTTPVVPVAPVASTQGKAAKVVKESVGSDGGFAVKGQ